MGPGERTCRLLLLLIVLGWLNSSITIDSSSIFLRSNSYFLLAMMDSDEE